MLSKEEFIVLNYYLGEGIPKAVIARKMGISRMTVYRHATGQKTKDSYKPRPKKPSLLDPYKEYISGRLKIYPELLAVRLNDEIKEMGYKGKYTLVKDYVRLIRPKAPIVIEKRFEVACGEQAQVDFATFKTEFGVVYALLVVLSWSRYLWVRFFHHQDQLTVLSGLHQSFKEFGGVPFTMLFDRMKTAVAKTESDGKAIFNDELLRFSTHYGFRPAACRPYRAKTKGRVERAVSYLRNNFFYGRQFRNIEDLNAQTEKWLKDTANLRIHGTTRHIPSEQLQKEREYLKSLPATPYIPMITLGRRISRDGFIAYNGNEYSVPDAITNRDVEVRVTLEKVCLYQDGKLLASHPLFTGRGKRLADPMHGRWNHDGKREKSCSLLSIGELIDVQRRSLDVYEEVLR